MLIKQEKNWHSEERGHVIPHNPNYYISSSSLSVIRELEKYKLKE